MELLMLIPVVLFEIGLRYVSQTKEVHQPTQALRDRVVDDRLSRIASEYVENQKSHWRRLDAKNL